MIFSASLGRFHYFLIVVVASILFIGCRKEKPGTDIEGVTGYSWKVGAIQEVTDYILRPRSGDWQLKLIRDGSFSLNLDGAVCRGTYTWTATEDIYPSVDYAQVSFSVRQWSNPPAGTADDLKRILQAVTTCTVYHPSSAPSFGSIYSPYMALEFRGSAGYFNVYR